MGKESFFNKHCVIFRNGFLFILLFVIAAYLGHGVWNVVQTVGWYFCQNQLLNFSLNILCLVVISYGAGALLSLPGFKNLISGLLGTLPLVGSLIKFMDFLERIKTKGAYEAEFELIPGSSRYTLGIVTNESEPDEAGVVWCSVHCPIQAFPGGLYLSKVRKSDLRPTGRSAWQAILTCLSAGTM